jgi:hypothetical protein
MDKSVRLKILSVVSLCSSALAYAGLKILHSGGTEEEVQALVKPALFPGRRMIRSNDYLINAVSNCIKRRRLADPSGYTRDVMR